MSAESRTDQLPAVPLRDGRIDLSLSDLSDLLGFGPQPEGLPDFSQVTPGRLRAAFDLATAAQLEQIRRIIASTEAPSFGNTVTPLELSAVPVRRVLALIHFYVGGLADAKIEELWQQLAPRAAAHHSAVHLDTALHERLSAIGDADLTPEEHAVLELTLDDFEQAGAGLAPESRDRIAALQEELADLEAEFERRTQEQNRLRSITVTDAAELAGLSEDELRASAQAAEAAGVAGSWRLPLANTSQQPALTRLTRPETRRRLLAASLDRGLSGEADDTRGLITAITARRALLAGELGWECFADLVTHYAEAGSTGAVGDLLAKVLGPASAKAEAELTELRDFGVARGLVDPEQIPDELILDPADVWHLLQARREDLQGDAAADLQRFFDLEVVFADGVLYAAQQLYGITVTEREDLVLPHPDMRAFDVVDHDGHALGHIIVDFFARPGKGGGAWMNQLVDPSRLTDTRAVAALTCNYVKPAPGAASQLTLDEVTTLFHEFGHVLHAMLSDVTYPSRAGTSVPRDAVEYPSQVNEMWQYHPAVIANYAWDPRAGEGIDAGVLARVEDSQRFGQGIETLEFTAAVLLDLSWHSLQAGEVVEDVEAFELEVLQAAGIPPEIPPRYRSGYFRHVFASGYAAGYYSYLWSEVLAADTATWFRENGGLDPDLGDSFRRTVLGPGGTRGIADSFAKLRGRVAITAPLLIQRGITEPES